MNKTLSTFIRSAVMTIAAALLCTAVLCFGGTEAQAATINRNVCGTSGYWTAGTHTFKADLNGNGTSETVTVKITGDTYDYLKKITVSANGSTLLTKTLYANGIDCYNITVRYIRMTSGRNFLQIYGTGEDDWVTFNKIYRYSNKKLVQAANLCSVYGGAGDVTSVTSSSVKVAYRAQPAMLGWINYTLTYKYSDGSLVLSSQTTTAQSGLGSFGISDGLESYFKNNKFKCAKAMTFYTTAGGSTKAFTVSKGKFVTLTKVKVMKNYLYAQFSYNGETGWIGKVCNSYYDYSGRTVTGAYFEGVLDRLVG